MKYLILSFAILLLAGCVDPPSHEVVKAVAVTCKPNQQANVYYSGSSWSVTCVSN